jgi:hypothetical protein
MSFLSESDTDISRRTSEVALCGLEALPTLTPVSSTQSRRDSTDGSRTIKSADDVLQERHSSDSLRTGHDSGTDTPALPGVPSTREIAALDLCGDIDTTLWSRWANAPGDVDIISTIALLSHTLPDTEAILSRWDEAPLQLRPFSILRLSHVQRILTSHVEDETKSLQSVTVDEDVGHPDNTTDVSRESYRYSQIHDELHPLSLTQSDDSGETEYFEAESDIQDDSPSHYSFEITRITRKRTATPIPRLLPRDIFTSSGDLHRMSYSAELDPTESELWLRAQRQLMHRPLIADAEITPSSDNGEAAADGDSASLLALYSRSGEPSKWRTRLSFRALRNSFRSAKSKEMAMVVGGGTGSGTGGVDGGASAGPAGPSTGEGTGIPHSHSRVRHKLKKQRREDVIIGQPDDLDHDGRASITSAPYKVAEWLHAVFNPPSDTTSERHHSTIASIPR